MTFPVVSVAPIASMSGGQSRNGVSVIQDNVITSGSTQYAVYIKPDNGAYIATRTLPSTTWTSETSLVFFFGGTTRDGHNSYALGIDSTGRIHVSGDHHNVALQYMVTTNPHDLSSWRTVSQADVGGNASSVTYVKFTNCLDGTLLMNWRNGASGGGDEFLATYDTGTQTWSQVQLTAGGTANAYFNHWAVDPNSGRIHIMWCWRELADVNTNHDICYAYSDNNGATWRKTDGTAYTLPITQATGEKVLVKAQNTGLINTSGLDVDAAGHPRSAWIYRAAATNQVEIHEVSYTGSAWISRPLSSFNLGTDWLGADGTIDKFSRPSVVCFSNGTVWCLYAHSGLYGFDMERIAPTSQALYTDIDTLDYEQTYDSNSLRYNDKLFILLCPGRIDWTGSAATSGAVIELGMPDVGVDPDPPGDDPYPPGTAFGGTVIMI